MWAGRVCGCCGPPPVVVEQVYQVLLMHGLPEVDVLEGAQVCQHLDEDADVVAARLVQGVVERAHQVMVVDQVEPLLPHDDGDRAHPQVVMQTLRVLLELLLHAPRSHLNLRLADRELRRREAAHLELVELPGPRVRRAPGKLRVTQMLGQDGSSPWLSWRVRSVRRRHGPVVRQIDGMPYLVRTRYPSTSQRSRYRATGRALCAGPVPTDPWPAWCRPRWSKP